MILATKYDPSPKYIRSLIYKAGITQAVAANAMTMELRTLQNYLNPNHPSKIPHTSQMYLEFLAAHS